MRMAPAGDVVGGHRVAQEGEHPRTGDVAHRCGFAGHAVEVRRPAYVGRAGVPGEHLGARDPHAAPVLVTGEDVGIAGGEHRCFDTSIDHLLDLRRGRPDVPQVHGIAVPVPAERLAEQLGVQGAGEGVRDDQRRGGEEVHLAVGVDPALEVAVPDSTEHTVRSCSVTAALTTGISGPEFPMQVVQP